MQDWAMLIVSSYQLAAAVAAELEVDLALEPAVLTELDELQNLLGFELHRLLEAALRSERGESIELLGLLVKADGA